MHPLTPYFTSYPPAMPAFLVALLPFLAVALVWTIILKGFALWHAARGSQKWWFVALLIVNTLGILEIIYLIWFRPSSSLSSSPSTPADSSSAGV